MRSANGWDVLRALKRIEEDAPHRLDGPILVDVHEDIDFDEYIALDGDLSWDGQLTVGTEAVNLQPEITEEQRRKLEEGEREAERLGKLQLAEYDRLHGVGASQ